jgi:outer membrane protein assembly factor BamB
MVAGVAVEAQEWTRFRGPNGTGISEARSIPTSFTEADWNWKVKLPGVGVSQPVFWGEKIFVTSAPEDGSKRFVSCLHTADGRTLWTIAIPSAGYRKHRMNAFASGSPAVDAKRVYYAFQHGSDVRLSAATHLGKKVWTHDLGPFASQHGFAGSPIVHNETVILPFQQRNLDNADRTSFVVALEAATGRLKWKTPRRSRRECYSTPCVHESRSGRTELVFAAGACGLYGLDANTGELIWEADAFDKRSCSSPVVSDDLVIGTCGSGRGPNSLVAVRPGRGRDAKKSRVVYRITKSIPYVPTVLARANRLYLWSDKGIVTCLETPTGRTVWQGRAGGNYSASPVWIGGRLFCVNHDGELVVVGTGESFEVLGRSRLGELSRTAPAVAGGRLYLRTMSHLVSVGGDKSD